MMAPTFAGYPTERSQRPAGASVDAIYAVGHWLLERDRLADAVKVFRVLVRSAPSDERGWLGLGECHERVSQLRVAAELYGAGSVACKQGEAQSVRCLLARARVAILLGEDAEALLDEAERAASLQHSEELTELVSLERRCQR